MSADEIRLWMVERSYDTRNLVTLIYATTDGQRYYQKELSSNMLSQTEVTAAIDADPESLEPVEDIATQDRYATEAERMEEMHAPNDEV
jgi:hypothetical protein